jgi:hypothetical protein
LSIVNVTVVDADSHWSVCAAVARTTQVPGAVYARTPEEESTEHPDVVEALKVRLEGFRADWPKWVPRDGSVHPRDAALKEGLEALGYVQ